MVSPQTEFATAAEGHEALARRDWLCWQLADSAFPTGGFAHSGGVEAAFQLGELNTSSDLILFLEASLCQSGHGALPFVSAAHTSPNDLPEIDLHYDAFVSNHITNRASRAQGQSLLSTTTRAFPNPELIALKSEVLEQKLPGHLAPLFGVITSHLKLDRISALRLFLFTQLRGWISSAVRLGIIGPFQAQSIQYELSPHAEEILGQCSNLSLDQIAQTAPLLDLFHGNHDRLYSRLFQS
jgi:urease accessory protein